jgi:hypothetical protein
MDYGTVKDSAFVDIKFLAIHMVERDAGALDGLRRWAEVILFRKTKARGGGDESDEDEGPGGTGACGECCIRLFEYCLNSDIFRGRTHIFLQSDNGNGFHGIPFLGYLSGVREAILPGARAVPLPTGGARVRTAGWGCQQHFQGARQAGPSR